MKKQVLKVLHSIVLILCLAASPGITLAYHGGGGNWHGGGGNWHGGGGNWHGGGHGGEWHGHHHGGSYGVFYFGVGYPYVNYSNCYWVQAQYNEFGEYIPSHQECN